MSKSTKLRSIRIIGGQLRGRRLTVPDVEGLRPTINRVRETVFNWLMHDLAGARCLDLFAGTGALGLESLSRGASYVQFVELNALAIDYLESNLAIILDAQQLKDRTQIVYSNVLNLLVKSPEQPYDVVFLDPPFTSDLLEASLELLETNNWLAAGAMIYLEQDVTRDTPQVPGSWELHRHDKAGQSAYYLYIS